MRVGKSWQQKNREYQDELKALSKGEDWFAWYPVKSNHGVWVWLEVVHLDYLIYQRSSGEYEVAGDGGAVVVHLKGGKDGSK